uniref:Cro/CI family transcriptional regulator n=1 Tax=Comamonas testosteroni TaxID=285 RepID=UPI0015FE7C31|nr:Cro/CI family transcriptional regulator [Comamonas testosteroni]
MKKDDAIELLGGSVATAAEAIGVSYQAVRQWPEELPQRIIDRVQAALWRQHARNTSGLKPRIQKAEA